MAIAGGNINIDSTEGMDKITQTEKVTSPYFSDGSTTLSPFNALIGINWISAISSFDAKASKSVFIFSNTLWS